MTPWELAKTSEHSQQRALFAWANCASLYGFLVASDPRGYNHVERSDWFMSDHHLVTEPVPALRLLFAIHNQGHGDAIRGNRAKVEGVKAGVPDMFLPVPQRVNWELGRPHNIYGYIGLFIELKRPDAKVGLKKLAKGRAKVIQLDWIDELIKQGYYATTAVGWIEAANVISWYMGSQCRVSPTNS